MAIPVQVGVTQADLLRLGAQDQRYEVIQGELVSMSPVGVLHVLVAANVYRLLYAFAVEHKLGYVFTDSLIYVLERDSHNRIIKAYIPDCSFVRKDNFPTDFDIKDPFPGVPDLAVEVISPGDSAAEMLEKVRGYLAKGTEQVWVLYPEQAELHQYARNTELVRVYRGEDEVEASAFFPGLQIVTASLFIALPRLD